MNALKEQLDSIKAKSADKMTAKVTAAMKEGFEALKQRDVLDKPLNVGDTAPSFALPNAKGDVVHLQDFLAKGPLVILFYRGKW
jgi:hypothetical protein